MHQLLPLSAHFDNSRWQWCSGVTVAMAVRLCGWRLSPRSARYVCKTVFIAIILVNLFSNQAGAFSNLALMLLMTVGTLQVPPYLHQGLGITLVACRVSCVKER